MSGWSAEHAVIAMCFYAEGEWHLIPEEDDVEELHVGLTAEDAEILRRRANRRDPGLLEEISFRAIPNGRHVAALVFDEIVVEAIGVLRKEVPDADISWRAIKPSEAQSDGPCEAVVALAMGDISPRVVTCGKPGTIKGVAVLCEEHQA